MSEYLKNFLYGAGQLFDINGDYAKAKLNKLLDYSDDEEALRKDWVAVGNHIRDAINEPQEQ